MRFSRFIPVAFATMAALPAVASAQFSITNLQEKFTTGMTVTIGNPANGSYAPVGPYESQFNTPGAKPFDVYCIDWDNAFGLGATYNARILTFAEAVSTTLTYNGIDNFTALKRILGGDAFNAPGGVIPNSQSEYFNRLVIESALAGQFGPAPTLRWDEIHHAMWSLFNTNALPDPTLGIPGSDAELANGLGIAGAPGYDFSNWRIILDESAWNRVDAGSYHQALISQSVVPEPGTYLLVGTGLIGLFGFKRRRNRAATN